MGLCEGLSVWLAVTVSLEVRVLLELCVTELVLVLLPVGELLLVPDADLVRACVTVRVLELVAVWLGL